VLVTHTDHKSVFPRGVGIGGLNSLGWLIKARASGHLHLSILLCSSCCSALPATSPGQHGIRRQIRIRRRWELWWLCEEDW